MTWYQKIQRSTLPTAIAKYMSQVDQNAIKNLPSYIYVEPLYRIYEFADRTMFRGFEFISAPSAPGLLDTLYYDSHGVVTDIILKYQQKYALPRITLTNKFELFSIGNRDNKVSTSEYSVMYNEGMILATDPKNNIRDVSDHYTYHNDTAKLVRKQEQITEDEAAEILEKISKTPPPPSDDADEELASILTNMAKCDDS